MNGVEQSSPTAAGAARLLFAAAIPIVWIGVSLTLWNFGQPVGPAETASPICLGIAATWMCARKLTGRTGSWAEMRRSKPRWLRLIVEGVDNADRLRPTSCAWQQAPEE